MAMIAPMLDAVAESLDCAGTIVGFDDAVLDEIGVGEAWRRLRADSVRSLQKELDDDNARLSVVVLPFNETGVGRHAESVAKERLDDVAAAALLRREGEDRWIGVLAPARFLSSPRQHDLRERWTESMYPTLVVEGSSRVLVGESNGESPPRGSGLALILFGDGAYGRGPTRFFVVPEEVGPTAITRDFKQLLKQPRGNSKYGWIYDGAIDAATSLSSMRYAPEVARLKRELADLGEAMRLEDVAQVIPPVAVEVEGMTMLERTVPVLQGRDINNLGRLQPVIGRTYASPSESALLRSQDICVRRAVGPRDERLALVELGSQDLPLVGSDSVICLRLDLDEITRRLALDYLRSPRALRLLRPGPGGFHVEESDLLNVEVPLPTPRLRTALSELGRSEHDVRRWLAEIEQVRRSLVDSDDERASVALARVLHDARIVRQRVMAAREMDRLEVRLRLTLPYPLAHAWRAVETSSSDIDGYLRVLRAAETTAAFLAVVAVMAARDADQQLSKVREIAERLQTGHQLGFGDWSSIVEELNGENFRKRAAGTFACPELLESVPQKSEAATALRDLRQRRNDQAHGKGPDGDADVAAAFHAGRGELRTLLAAVEFLAEYPLRYVETTQWDSLEQRNVYSFRELMGDHPLVPAASASSRSADVEAKSLYLVGAQDRLLLLRPLLIRAECDECGASALFLLESARPPDTVHMRALDHGHVIARPDLWPALEAVGFARS